MPTNVKLEDYEGTHIEKSFKKDVIKGNKCSKKKKECVDEVMKEGKDESSAYAICTNSVGK